MSTVITGIGIICSEGNCKSEVLKRMKRMEVTISEIELFNCDDYLSNKGGLIGKDFRNKISEYSKENDVDQATALAILTINEAIEDSGLDNITEAGISLGTCNGGINSLSEYVKNNNKQALLKYPLSQITKDIKEQFGLKGNDYTFNNACSASGSAISLASELINNKFENIMIAGGVDVFSEYVFAGFNSLKALSPEKATPFGENKGLNLGEGSSFFILEDKNNALKRGATIYGEICGYGLSNDAFHITAPEKNGEGIARAIKSCIKDSKFNIKDIKYINAHGTGTLANDSAEIKGIRNVFEKLPLISSFKGYFGHTLGAASSIELAVTLLGLQEEMIFSNIGVKKLREECNEKEIFKKTKKVSICEKGYKFLNLNSAFGGHNVCLAVNVSNKYKYDIVSNQENEVYISEYVTCNNKFVNAFDYHLNFDNPNQQIKEYNNNLFERRMTGISQQACIASNVLVKNRDIELGVILGTSLGNLSSTFKYIETIIKNGKDKASALLFPKIVMNSIAGDVCRKNHCKEYSVSISSEMNEDLKCLEIGYLALKNRKTENLLVGIANENSKKESLIFNNHNKSSEAIFTFMSRNPVFNSKKIKISRINYKHSDLGTLENILVNETCSYSLKNRYLITDMTELMNSTEFENTIKNDNCSLFKSFLKNTININEPSVCMVVNQKDIIYKIEMGAKNE